MHLHANTARKCIFSTSICALIYIRLTFGGSFSPAEWCILIELLTDLANDIANNPFWKPNRTQAAHPDPQSIPPSIKLTDNTPFTPALPVNVSLNLPRHGWIDGCIDKIVGICLNLQDNATRPTKEILLEIAIFARPTNSTPKNIPHPYILSMKK